MENYQKDLDLIEQAGKQAGRIALKFFGGENQVWTKSGDSPVSQADFAVDKFLKDTLLAARPDYGWLSEETEDDEKRLKAKRVFVVDPIDGTRGFIAGSNQWCISIAIVENQQPIAGVLECPALRETFKSSRGAGSYLNNARLSIRDNTTIKTLSGSKKMIAELSDQDQIDVHPFIPSLAYRIAMVATGKLDAAIARPGAHEWDIAAAEMILNEVGCQLVGLTQQSHLYNQLNHRVDVLLASSKSSFSSLKDVIASSKLFEN